jgi:hypothetical protein
VQDWHSQRLAIAEPEDIDSFCPTQEAGVVEPAPQRSMKRVFIWVLIIIIAIWIVYALAGGPSTPTAETAPAP